MLYFQNDYHAACCPGILERLNTADRFPGYGTDAACRSAADRIRELCGDESLQVHFLTGGTLTNLTVISAALRPYQGVLAASSGHIHVHETGAVEGTGHKVLELPSKDGKIRANQVGAAARAHFADGEREHTVQPKMVYISQPTELGTLYTLQELRDLSAVCRKYGLYLFVDGARLSYGLAAAGNDVTLPELAKLTDVFYIGGTKCGAMFGEAVVISNPALAENFRYMMKRQGAMLAKGWLLGVQFQVLMENGLYERLAAYADHLADEIRDTLRDIGAPLLVPGTTNQIFAVLPDSVLEKLSESVLFTEYCRADDTHRVIRLCTGWNTPEEDVQALCSLLRKLCPGEKEEFI